MTEYYFGVPDGCFTKLKNIPLLYTTKQNCKLSNMSYISVKFKIIIPQNYKDVVNEYNKTKPSSWEPLTNIEHVDAVGGFEISMPDEQAIKQVSWHQKGLRTKNTFRPFSEEEVCLLYNAMIKVFGTDQIELKKQ
jgi:hypothetical protein